MFQNRAEFQYKQTIKSTKHPGVVYEVRKTIGQGVEGAAYSGIDLISREKVVIEIFYQMSENQQKCILKLAEQNFKHIIKIYDLICQPNQYIVIREFVDGDLYTYITQNPQFKYDDRKTRHSYFLQIIKGVKELHSLDLLHRNLKPENVVYIKENNGMILKLQDFGLAKEQSDSYMTKNIGTPYYQAPELLFQNNYVYTNKVDIWALGMMWHELLCGSNMMDSKSIKDLQDQIRSLTDEEILKKISILKVFQEEWELNIIKRMLVIDPAQRMSANELYKIFKECLPQKKNANPFQNVYTFQQPMRQNQFKSLAQPK